MVRRKIIRSVMCAAAIVLLPALAGCTGWKDVSHTNAPRLTAYKEHTGLRWTHVSYVAAPGRTAHEDDTGSRWTYVPHTTGLRQVTYYDYYYYPDVKVYYHIHTGYYYYYIDGSWQHSKQRPEFLYLDDNRRQTVVIRNVVKPYAQHAAHRRQYPAQPIPPGHASNQAPGQNKPKNAGVGNGVVPPEHQPQPQNSSTGKSQAQNQPLVQPQPQPKPQPVKQVKPLPLPESSGKGKG